MHVPAVRLVSQANPLFSCPVVVQKAARCVNQNAFRAVTVRRDISFFRVNFALSI